MSNETQEYPVLTDDILLEFEDKIYDHSITVEDCKLIDHYYSNIQHPGHLLELLKEDGIDSIREAACILRQGDFNFEDENDYPGVYGLFIGCLELLQEHLDRGEKIQ